MIQSIHISVTKMFTEVLKRTDVTAVTFYNNSIILIALGGEIHLYQISLDSFVNTKIIFEGQRIHGFIVRKEFNHVIAFGGNLLKILKICQNNESSVTKYCVEFENDCDFNCNDWIQSVCWTNNNTSLAILTSHNFIQIWHVGTRHKEIYQPEKICILYSGCLYDLADSLLVFAGTVFSQVLIYSLKEKKHIHILEGHKGVIFSITWNEEHRVIVSTSDDRSLKIWSVQSCHSGESPNHISFWTNASITCQYTLFGHTARVWRALVAKDSVVSIGEDSKICVWSLNGALQKKIKSHQGGCIWSVDYSPELNRVVTGGGDGAVILQPLSLLSAHNVQEEAILHCAQVAKKICLTCTGNIVCLTEMLTIVYYNVKERQSYNVETKKKFLLLSTIDRYYFAFADQMGNIAVYREINYSLQYFTSYETEETRLLSLHWADELNLVASGLDGNMMIFNINKDTGDMHIVHKFSLLPCKERWLTAATSLKLEGFRCFLYGDRCGNLHLYNDWDVVPVKTLYKVHGHLGINSINLVNNCLVTTGRDGFVKYYELSKNTLQFLYRSKVPFVWVEKIIKDYNLVCGFRESSFILYDKSVHQEIVDLNCGGGHRSWDIEFTSRSKLRLCYLKNANICLFNIVLSDVMPKVILQGTHTKEINCMEIAKTSENENLIISGSEDTSIRISIHNSKLYNTFKELIILRQLSNVRSVSLEPLESRESNKIDFLLVAAGGRAEISIKILSFPRDKGVAHIFIKELCSYMLKGTDKQRKGGNNWRNIKIDFDPETRFMSIKIILLNKNSGHSLRVLDNLRTILFVGCSDSYFRVYELERDGNMHTLYCLATLKFHKTCILKVKCFQLHKIHFVLTMATDGIIAFWNVTDIVENHMDRQEFCPISHFKIHKSGVNECDLYHLEDNILIIASGGDDNCVTLNVYKIDFDKSCDKISVMPLASSSRDQWHCAQVTGIKFINNDKLLSASIDQRISLISWKYEAETKYIQFDLIEQTFCDVPDIRGIQMSQRNREQCMLYVYGKGLSAWSNLK